MKVEVPCTLFQEFDISRTLVDDHLVQTGYNPILLETMRSHFKDSRFEFKNDVTTLFEGAKYDPASDKKEGSSDEEKAV
jgi:hypothetical protein